MRLKYRYLDLRSAQHAEDADAEGQTVDAIRRHMVREGFIEVETPILTKSTPEGARDFLVPSRHHPGTFYALPQSLQIYKQLLMVGALTATSRLLRCFRDEDSRADRQPWSSPSWIWR